VILGCFKVLSQNLKAWLTFGTDNSCAILTCIRTRTSELRCNIRFVSHNAHIIGYSLARCGWCRWPYAAQWSQRRVTVGLSCRSRRRNL
jgi:hypothetical protein